MVNAEYIEELLRDLLPRGLDADVESREDRTIITIRRVGRRKKRPLWFAADIILAARHHIKTKHKTNEKKLLERSGSMHGDIHVCPNGAPDLPERSMRKEITDHRRV